MIPTSYERPLKEMMQAISSQQLVFEKTNAWRFFPSKLKRLQRFAQSTATTRRLCEKILEREGLEASTEAAGEEQLGWVHTWKGTFGFIQQEHGPQRYFFPASAVENLTQRAGDIDLAGKAVRFTVQDDERGARAGWVLLVER